MKVNYETFMRFFRNECTPEEQQAVMRWVNESEEHKNSFSGGKNCTTWEKQMSCPMKGSFKKPKGI